MQVPLLLFTAIFKIDETATPEQRQEAILNITRILDETCKAIVAKAPVALTQDNFVN